MGLKKPHWDIIQAIVMEVNDVDNNIKKAKKLLTEKGFKHVKLEKEKGFEKTKLINIYAQKN